VSLLKAAVIHGIIQREGDYVDRPEDSGGPTRYGITEAVARAAGYIGPMRTMPIEIASSIYARRYWDALSLGEIELLSPLLAEELADTGVNQGVKRAAEHLQRALNVLNNRGEIYPDIAVDGDIGPLTLYSLRAYLQRRGKEGITILHRMLNSLQGAFYVGLAERREKDETFIYGWFKNRVV